MNIWEIALLLIAITFMVVNMVSVFINIKMIGKLMPLFDRSMKFMDKYMDKAEEQLKDLD